MKKKLVCIMVILSVLFAGTAFAGSYANAVAKRMSAAKKLYDKKYNNANTTFDMKESQNEYIEFLDGELNTVYKKIMALLPQKEKNRLRNEERKWIKTRDRQADKNAAEFEGGTLAPVEYNHTYIKYDEQRLMYLANYYDRIKK